MVCGGAGRVDHHRDLGNPLKLPMARCIKQYYDLLSAQRLSGMHLDGNVGEVPNARYWVSATYRP